MGVEDLDCQLAKDWIHSKNYRYHRCILYANPISNISIGFHLDWLTGYLRIKFTFPTNSNSDESLEPPLPVFALADILFCC